jgi:hypothetical protein
LEKSKEILELNKRLLELCYEYWSSHVVFTFPWWFVIATLIIPWIIWWKLVDKKRIKSISLVGLITMIISFILDQVGTSLLLWEYPVTPSPLPRDVFDPADFAILPVSYMLIYQYFKNWKLFIISQVVFAFFASYVGGNIYGWLGIYKILNWRHIYSVPIYLLMGIVTKKVVDKLNNLELLNTG